MEVFGWLWDLKMYIFPCNVVGCLRFGGHEPKFSRIVASLVHAMHAAITAAHASHRPCTTHVTVAVRHKVCDERSIHFINNMGLYT